MWHLKNKKVLITGGTKGIGKAAVEEFLSLGAEVLFTARDEEAVKTMTSELLKKENIAITGLAADSTKEKDNTAIKTWIEKNWGVLDVLVNNAGTNIRKRSNDYRKDEYDTIMNVNIAAPFFLSNLLFDFLKKAGSASVINVASVAGSLDVGSGSPYGISKAGLIQMSRNLAVEWAPHGIRVNSVSPWYTETPLNRSRFSKQGKIGKNY